MGIINTENNKKYLINEHLDRLSGKHYRLAMKVLPDELGVSVATFNNYRSIKLNDKQDVPYIVIVKLERFFGLEPGMLQNFEIEMQSVASRVDESEPDIIGDFQLTR